MDLIKELMRLQRQRERINLILDDIDEGVISVPSKVNDVLINMADILDNLFG